MKLKFFLLPQKWSNLIKAGRSGNESLNPIAINTPKSLCLQVMFYVTFCFKDTSQDKP